MQMSRALKTVIGLVNGMRDASFAIVQELGWSQLFAKFDANVDGTLTKGAIFDCCSLFFRLVYD